MGNRGFGASVCNQCGGMMSMDETVCESCGMMSEDVLHEIKHGDRSGPKNDAGMTYEAWIAMCEDYAEQFRVMMHYGAHSRDAWQNGMDAGDYVKEVQKSGETLDEISGPLGHKTRGKKMSYA
ncbi:MAG TPA: hypothetical protein VIJ14_10540, partial [Rhabdochlamydiaceae bacterium]